jgi:Holliday junction resolvase RusA-like endonuclease
LREAESVIAFTVPGKPQPWRRARTNGKSHFKDARTKANQNAWAWACRGAMGAALPIGGPVAVDVVARFAVPVRTNKANRAAMLAGQVMPICTPDADNIAKNLDALNGVAFTDDAQIVRLTVVKRYAETAGVTVTIEPLEAARDVC